LKLLSNNKIISNGVCASIGCQMFSTTRIKFSIGFSANFCSPCAADLIRDGVGTNEETRVKPPQTDSGVETLDQSAMVDTRTASERDPNNG